MKESKNVETVKAVEPVNTVDAELKSLTKEELVTAIKEYENLLLHLEDKISTVKVKPEGRKSQVLEVLKTGNVTVAAIAERLGITARNVSSQLSYLRKDGYAIATDSLGRKFLESNQPVKEEVVKPVVRTILRKA